MFFDRNLRLARRALVLGAAALALGTVAPAWAQDDEDDDSPGDRKEIRVYRGGDEDSDSDSDDQGTKVLRFRTDTADSKGGYLGVRVQDVTRALMRARDLTSDEGALVNRVEDGSPADEAGIQRGDVIVQVDRKDITDSGALIKVVRGLKPETKASVVLVRDGHRKTVEVEIAKRPPDMMMMGPGFRWRSEDMPNPEQFREYIRQGGPGNEVRAELDRLREEVDQLRDEIRELKSQLRDRGRSGSRSGS